MKTIEVTKATASLSDYVRKVAREPIIVTSNGKPMVAVVSIKNADLETASLCTNPQFLALIERSRTRQKKEGGISSKEMRRRLGLNK